MHGDSRSTPALGFVDPEEDNTNAMGFDFFSQLDCMPPPSIVASIYI